ncbi:MAG: epoxyqueuosine reductase [Acidobacteriota bacterium]
MILTEIKQKIREYAMSLGVDDVGFASVADYKSPRTKDIASMFPEAKSMVVVAIREGSHIKSLNPRIAFSGRMDIMEFGRGVNYKLARFLERECGAMAMSVPLSYPMEMSPKTMGVVADVSLRHAAIAAGLGKFGRNNLVLHPKFGSRVLFGAILTDLDLPSDPPVTEDICTDCGICVDGCPGGALDVEGITDPAKCLKNSQPYGLGKIIGFWSKFVDKTPEEQKQMFLTEDFWSMYQAQFIGFQYFCFNCESCCPLND